MISHHQTTLDLLNLNNMRLKHRLFLKGTRSHFTRPIVWSQILQKCVLSVRLRESTSREPNKERICRFWSFILMASLLNSNWSKNQGLKMKKINKYLCHYDLKQLKVFVSWKKVFKLFFFQSIARFLRNNFLISFYSQIEKFTSMQYIALWIRLNKNMMATLLHSYLIIKYTQTLKL